VLVNGDSKLELNERFRLAWGSPVADLGSAALESPSRAAHSSARSATTTRRLLHHPLHAEGTGGATTGFVFNVSPSNPVQGGFRIGYATADDIATSGGGDYLSERDSGFRRHGGEPRPSSFR
jgi:hypothetical protein